MTVPVPPNPGVFHVPWSARPPPPPPPAPVPLDPLAPVAVPPELPAEPDTWYALPAPPAE